VTLARNIWLPDDGPRTETCWSVFNVLMCKFYKFYICAVVDVVIEYTVLNLCESIVLFYYICPFGMEAVMENTGTNICILVYITIDFKLPWLFMVNVAKTPRKDPH